jgi:hypothetical protein
MDITSDHDKGQGMSELEMTKEEKALEIVEATQEYKREKAVEPLKVGDRVVHSQLFISVCRGEARARAKEADMEVIGLTERSVTTRPWGSTQKYGPQFDRRYIRRPDPAKD